MLFHGGVIDPPFLKLILILMRSVIQNSQEAAEQTVVRPCADRKVEKERERGRVIDHLSFPFLILRQVSF